ncbi:Uncharacterised protein [Mycolicibacterium vanbaalenii]|uniref:SnoaL-like domain-containing protein n=1 Tax=Mycolicibacterium vanbaalenii TaxID=110539 RepID=A0A5S9PPG4_MYCVN|nr:nuclear transport factor 2 family protein [Mycolicibacterium vanbaalenii]CAA0105885.1 Uncharacterised protein [Mycolicibacterium vanbaalenii]
MSAPPSSTADALALAITDADDPVICRNLQVVAEHVDAEIAGDLDRLMATLVDEPIYHVWGASQSVGPQGHDEVRANYENLVTSGKNRLEYRVSRVVADRSCVVTEGHFVFAYPGVVLPHDELPTGEAILADHWYLVEYKCVVLWPVDAAGRIEGEELYAGEVPQVVRALYDGELTGLGPRDRRNGTLTSGWI